MKLILFLSGEFEELARIEAKTFFVRNGGDAILFDDQIAVGFCDDESLRYFNRFGMIHESSSHLFSGDIDDLHEFFREVEILNGKCCIRVRNIGKRKVESSKLERELGAILWKRGAKISVSNPDYIYKVYLAKKAHVGILLYTTNKKQFLERRPDLKPFFRPGAILPRFARSLVNIAIGDGILLDPMCGTGTILIEAGLMGLNFVGIEAYEDVARGCSINLRHYNLPLNVIVGDAKNMPLNDCSVDAIVTDFPYLQSTKSLGDIVELYEKSLTEFHRVLKRYRTLIFISNLDVEEIAEKNFLIEHKLYQRLHKSLTRRIYICKKLDS